MKRKSLFETLRKDKSLEDYFTEIVVHLFTTSPEILYIWLKDLQLIEDSSLYIDAKILSQCACQGGRIDIQIELLDRSYNHDVIFIESKIYSKEHGDQLRRYAKHLHSQPGIRNKTLLYVTRGDGPKDEAKVLEGIPAVRFEQVRWYTLQRILLDQPKDLLLDEIIIFMDKNGMGLVNNDKLTQEVERINLSGANLSGATLSGVDLSKANLSGVNLTNANLSETNLVGTNLRGANLKGANLYKANLSRADLCGADLRDTNLQKAFLRQVKIDATTQLDRKWRLVCEINGQDARGRDLHGADLSEVNLSGADLSYANLSQANFDGTNLQGTILRGANLNGVNLPGTNNLIGVDLSETDLCQFDFSGVKLPGGNLSFTKLHGVNFSGTDLSKADLRHSEAQNVNLSDVSMLGADLRGANLSNAYLIGADLCGADLSNAYLTGADLHGANLFEADMRGLKYDHFTIWPEGFTPPADAEIL